ncbi:copper amine oxidase N-terminal domain-containing protein [Paenibacillus sp. S28]|uniref:copper amine oxidase N-terminal domain-containing protein n=1 Tax=Paenibacillus sp. S28 TaxID=2767463 RepID=UPI001F2B4794|nr:copper amine oxidase N-terminal domain-containing protein [Paenibacillus sp. S28]
MMKKITMASISFLCAAAILLPDHSIGTAAARTNSGTHVIINNQDLAPKDVLIKNNQIFISFTEAKALDNITFQWNHAAKQVTAKGKDTNLLLTINRTTALKNGKAVKLNTAPFIYDGKTMIPLRFVTETMGGSVTWNPSTQTVYIAKASSYLASDLKSDELSVARNAAINLPRVSLLPKINTPTYETSSIQYYFPEKVHDQFFEKNNNAISYFEISGHTAYLKWQGLITNTASTQKQLYFINGTITNEIGTRPSVKDSTFAAFRWMPHIGSTGYSLIHKDNWNDVVYKETEVESNNAKPNYIIVQIPEEE